LTLCHAKVERKTLVFPVAKMLGGGGTHRPTVHPKFAIADFRW